MTLLPSPRGALPLWEERLLRASLPTGAMCDAIVGDLHEEFVRDTAQLGLPQARRRYRHRATGIVAYAFLDAVRLRPWSSEAAPVTERVPIANGAALVAPRGLLGRADVALFMAAFGVLGLGIVANTMLFSVVRHVPPATAQSAGGSSALAVASVLLALGTAGVAAVMLCVGPRWLRRRACREAVAHHAAAQLVPQTPAVRFDAHP